MTQVTIYHNPRCSKSRQCLSLLRDQQLDPIIIEYLNDPPSIHQLTELLTLLAMKPRDLLRKGEQPYKTLNLDDLSLSDAQILNAMHEHPILIQRPIILANGKAVIGRPPEKCLEICHE